ncbi:hypothetical protein [Micromonospora sp. CA-246542]|uniref:hypothetical protein n=1 Tax=Micromonospora sp. CA-246542 TaxID=3239959 RepID=UPI003D940E54
MLPLDPPPEPLRRTAPEASCPAPDAAAMATPLDPPPADSTDTAGAMSRIRAGNATMAMQNITMPVSTSVRVCPCPSQNTAA